MTAAHPLLASPHKDVRVIHRMTGPRREDACSTDYASSTQRVVNVPQTAFRSREAESQ